ncbi:MAG: phosphatase PAP2 family protein [Clostridia bacterium]|nr:phosphatase PAP2 family protein [Clostridia bacterium]
MKRKSLIPAAIFFGIFISLVIYIGSAYGSGPCAVDRIAQEWINSIRSPGLDAFFTNITELASVKLMIALILVLLLIPKTRFKIGVPLAIGELTNLGIYILTKNIMQRPRPDASNYLIDWKDVMDYSFPSGHSATSIFVYLLLAYILFKTFDKVWAKIGALILAILPVLVAFSRLYIGVHWFSDILCGIVLGLACLFAVKGIFYTDYKNSDA